MRNDIDGPADSLPESAATAPSPAILSLQVLRPALISFGGREVRLRSRKAYALVAYLAMEASITESRERLVGLLWSESPEDKARASLRQIVHELREALRAVGHPGPRFERATLSLAGPALTVDAQDVLRRVQSGEVHPLLLERPRLPDALMQGLDDLDPAFRVWLLARRQAFHDNLTRALEPLLHAGEARRAARRDAARAILMLDPTHEEACRCLMRICAEEGDPVGALRAYDALWKVLGDEYDTEPSLATQALVADIKIGQVGKATPEPAAERIPASVAPQPATAPPRIALLVEPFSVNGIVQAHLVQGFRHDLIARLVRFREWFVVDGSALPPAEQTATRVTARYRINATAYQVGERISMVLTLSEMESGIFVWSERLEVTLDGWFEAQQHVLRRIAVGLNMQISQARLTRLASEPDVTLDGYDRWLRCQHMLLTFNPAEWDRAFGMLQEMAARTPDFAPAFSNLAQLDNVAHIIRPGVRRGRPREERALRHARRAVELDPMDSRSQLCLGWSMAMMGKHAQADVHMRLALELNADDSWLLMSAALFYAFNGQHDVSSALGRQSLEMTLVPSRTHWGFEVTNAYLRGDDAATLEACDRAEDVIRTLQAWRAAALHNLGRQREAEQAAERFRRMVADAWFGEEAPTEAAMTRWLLHLYPIRRQEDWERLRAGIAGAGLPTDGAAHGDW